MEIVGVVGDAVYSSLRAQVPPTWYTPLSQFDLPEFTQLSFQFQLAVRSQTNSPVASNDVAAAIGRVIPALALTFRPLSDYVETARNQERLVALLAGAFGTLGLVLAGLGLYGITAYTVTVRRSEIGIRMALGAVAGRIVRLVLVRVAILVASGAAVGIAVSLWLSRFVAEPSLRSSTARHSDVAGGLHRACFGRTRGRRDTGKQSSRTIQPRFYGRAESACAAPTETVIGRERFHTDEHLVGISC